MSGTPSATAGKVYSITVTATNSKGSASQSFTLIVNQAPSITTASTATFTTGKVGTFTVKASGFPAATFSLVGALPSGVSFSPTTGILSGTAAAGMGGVYPITITATNGVGTNATQSFTLKVNQPPAITSSSTTTFTVGSVGNFSV